MVFANPPTRQATRVNLSQHQGATPQPPDGDLAGASPPGPLARSAAGSLRSCQTPRIRAGGPSISAPSRRPAPGPLPRSRALGPSAPTRAGPDRLHWWHDPTVFGNGARSARLGRAVG